MEDILHLNGLKLLLFLTGLLPPNIIKNKKTIHKIYKNYSPLIRLIFIISIICQFIAIVTVRLEDLSQVPQMLTGTILASIIVIRIFIIQSKSIRNLFELVKKNEERLLHSNDEDLQKIYVNYSKRAIKVNYCYLSITIFDLFYYNFVSYIQNFYLYNQQLQQNNTITRHTIQVFWTPYDQENHFVSTFSLTMIIGQYTGFFYAISHALPIALMVYVQSQLKILQHILKNLQKYSKIIERERQLSSDDAVFQTLKFCINEHKNIVNYVTTLRDSFKYAFLLEFCTNSVHMATLLYTIINGLDFVTSFNIPFLPTVMFQVFSLSWNANDIKIESFELSRAVYDNNWYEQNETNKKILQIMAIRFQKPLTITLGDFSEMSTETAVLTVKAGYSYTMLLMKMQKN